MVKLRACSLRALTSNACRSLTYTYTSYIACNTDSDESASSRCTDICALLAVSAKCAREQLHCCTGHAASMMLQSSSRCVQCLHVQHEVSDSASAWIVVPSATCHAALF